MSFTALKGIVLWDKTIDHAALQVSTCCGFYPDFPPQSYSAHTHTYIHHNGVPTVR